MKIENIRFLTLTLAILLLSCECPTDIDTPTVIKPTIFANVLFINAMPEPNLDSLIVLSSSKIIEFIDTIYYKENSNNSILFKEYFPVGIMVAGEKNTLRLAKTERAIPKDTLRFLFNSVLNIQKDSNYTFIAYGDEESVQSIMVKDNITNPMKENIYIRCFNVSPDAPVMHITANTDLYSVSFSLASGEVSDIANSPSGEYTITLTSADSSIKNLRIPNVQLSKGKINNVIFRGNFHNTAINRREVIVVTGNYPN
ncbi:MAG: DUF4397 domain-containing protein [bacterium]